MVSAYRFKTIRLSRTGPAATILLSRPRAGNRVNLRMAEELALASSHINQDDSLHAVVITGAGAVFSTGWEVAAVSSPSELRRYQAAGAIAGIQKPVIAALNGDAIGQGLELALAADIRLAASHARFAMPQVRHGLLPWDGGAQRLARVVGRAHALQMLLTGEVIDARAALRIGLVTSVASPEDLPAAAEEILGRVLAGAPIAMRYAKEAVREGAELSLSQGLHLEADLSILLQGTKDRAEGIRSFLERRSPTYKGA
ncbi:MAG: enoyl-CoA hydratase/isomerase family protein [Chloroflexi bacterium]|nr:enoyl-CoA hydratase/isomerase family protein [Chloroflexota bacterium]